MEFQSNDTQRRIKELLDLDHSNEDEREGIDVPYFELESIIAATDDFSEKNKLGQGGFGPVYKVTKKLFSVKFLHKLKQLYIYLIRVNFLEAKKLQ